MDIASLGAASQEDATEVVIKHPATGQPFGLTLWVAGYESDRVKRVERRLQNEALRTRRRKVRAEEIEENTFTIAASAVVRWDWPEGFELAGNPMPECTPQNVKELLRACPFVGEQLDAIAGDRAAFLEK